ncbi:hypothetical protein D6D21_09951 [Aureobasidium pullulans]|uniref:F-box domain-containing protein n=1 Tax=Aureobasidium pullulans TaxID=5580 RepID=A0AB74IK46_AURPU|nr:hypothetical protein D6D21_09951 [Aureobasidium pullulans]
MSNTTRVSPDLLSMPNEIIARICEYVAIHDHAKPISNLRLTCKHFYAPATKELAQKFLSEPHVMMTRYSLEALVEICKHPLFGPHVRGIAFESSRLSLRLFDDIHYRLRTSLTDKDLVAMTQARKQMTFFLELYEQEQSLQQTGEASKLVREACSLLRQYRNAVKMALTTVGIDHNGPYPMGYHKALAQFICSNGNGLSNFMSAKDVSSTLLLMLEASDASECEISSLDIGAWDFHHYDTCADLSNVRIASKVLTALTEIHLYLDPGPLQDGLDRILEATLPFANRLQKVYLEFGQDAESGLSGSSSSMLVSVARILESIGSEELVQLDLNITTFREADLLKFLGLHKKTLKQVTLQDLPLAGSWVQLLSWIRDNLSLDKLVIIRVSEFDEHDLDERRYGKPTLWFRGGFDIRGPTAMRPALDKFLAQKRKQLTGDENHGLAEYELDYGQPRVIE